MPVSNAWEVLTLFVIPIGGGIPAGVLLARSRGIEWPETAFLYLVSDVLLAVVFEPLMLLGVAGGKRSPVLARIGEAFKLSVAKATAHYGKRTGPLALVVVSFGVDPMTGRMAAAAAGHGFFAGWALAILGDLLYFAVLMVSTLWLSSVLGDGTVPTLIILLVMTIAPIVVRRFRRARVVA